MPRRNTSSPAIKTFEGIGERVNAETAILGGELVVVDHLGRSVFADMRQRRHPARYFAFDLLRLNGEDFTKLPLLTRKDKLKRILPSRSSHVLYVDHSRAAMALRSIASPVNWI